jgi:hypothetical protein
MAEGLPGEIETIYVFYRYGGTSGSWCPVQAARVGVDTFKLPEQNWPEDVPRWQFPPGSTVRCERGTLRMSGEGYWYAVALATPPSA